LFSFLVPLASSSHFVISQSGVYFGPTDSLSIIHFAFLSFLTFFCLLFQFRLRVLD